MTRSKQDTAPFIRLFADRARRRDLFALGIPPALLVAVYALPQSLRRAAALESAAPTPASAYASHFVHFASGHLVSNLLVYALVAPTIYLLCLGSGRRRGFFVAFATVLLGLPVALSTVTVLVGGDRLSYGFSGMNMALFGLLPFALWHYLHETFAGRLDDRSPALFFGGAALIAALSVPVLPLSVGLAAASLLSAALYLDGELLDAPSLGAVSAAADRGGYFELGAVGALLLVGVPVVAFPTDPLVPAGVLDLQVHALGYSLGYIPAFVLFEVVGVSIDGREDGSPSIQ